MATSSVTRIPVCRNPNYKANGTKSLVWLYQKYNITPKGPSRFHRNHKNVLMKTEKDGSASEVTSDDQQNDSFYTCPVLIGTPPQKLDTIFDSGSSDFWVWSTKLPAKVLDSAKAAGAAVYDPSQSSTQSPMTGSKWQIRYGDGSAASGTVVTDNVKVGDITIQNQAVEVASMLSSSLTSQTTSQGIFGLAFGSLNTVTPQRVATPLENMISQQSIPQTQELFTCYMGSYKDANDPDHGSSFYTFGQIDETVVQATGKQISYTPVDDSSGFWQFQSQFVTINGQKTPLNGGTAIADTGTTLVLIDDNLVEQIYSQISGARMDQQQGGWVFPETTSNDALPTVTLAIGNTPITIEKEQFGFGPPDSNGMVFGGIQGRGNSPYNIFGDTFLKCAYAVFDVGQKRFGVVQRVDPTPNGTQTGSQNGTH